MPTYDYHCYDCGIEWEAVHKVNERELEYCDECGKQAGRYITMTGRPVILEYYSENLNAHITGPNHRKEVMRQKGVEEAG